jgi:hypothetical protein
VALSFQRTARYVAEMIGVPGLTGIGVDPNPPGLKPGTKVFLGLIAFVVLLLALSDALTRLFMRHR